MGEKYGLLIPDDFVTEVPNEVDMNTASIFWGFSLGIALFSACTAGDQTWKSWKRSRRITGYAIMIWVVWISCMVMGVLAWGFQRQYILPSFGFYFNIALWWSFKMHCILQIIINRIGLLMVNQSLTRKMQWSVFAIILAINISVFCIWIPARLQINDTYIFINEIWDRCEKVIFAIVDAGLNFYFIYLVRTRLIDNGLTKYIPLYRVNLFLIFVSLSLDVALIGLMSLPSGLVYLSFHPVAYLLKLQIEMQMADLITKIVKSTGLRGSDGKYYYDSTTGGRVKRSGAKPNQEHLSGFHGRTTMQSRAVHDDDVELQDRGDNDGAVIRKTVETTIASSPAEEDAESRSSSTRNLHYHSAIER